MRTMKYIYACRLTNLMQVYKKNIDFWGEKLTVEEMTLQHTLKIYPPKVTMIIRPSTPAPQVLTIMVSNVREEDNLDEEIAFPFSMFLTYNSYNTYCHTILHPDIILHADHRSGLPFTDHASFTLQQSGMTCTITIAFTSHLHPQCHSGDVSDYSQLCVNTVAKYSSTNQFWNLKGLCEGGIDGDGVTVAILDSAVNKNHDAFSEIKLEGKNFIDGKPDDFWHSNHEPRGTMVAGIVAKVAPKARIFVCCVSNTMEFNSKAVIQALIYLNQTQIAQVVVMSFGCRPLTTEEEQTNSNDEKVKYKLERRRLISDLVDKGVVCVAAVGNQGLYGYGIASPACLPNVIAVGALNTYGFPSQLNNPGREQIDVYAPGERVFAPSSNDNRNFQVVKGTSCAAPAIGGVVALLLQGAATIGIHINDIKILKKIFSHMLKEVDGNHVLCPKEFFDKHSIQNLGTLIS